MTYAEIIAALERGKCEGTVRALDYAVLEEAKALAEHGNKWKRRDGGKFARESAREFYAEDITEQLRAPLPLTPDRILGHRRVHVVWAVAEVLRTNKLVKE